MSHRELHNSNCRLSKFQSIISRKCLRLSMVLYLVLCWDLIDLLTIAHATDYCYLVGAQLRTYIATRDRYGNNHMQHENWSWRLQRGSPYTSF